MSAGAHDPLAGFDATVHAPNRLRVCALLDTAGEAEFGLVQEQLGLSASVLSKHVTVLMDAGYVEQRKAVRDARQRVWLRLTPGGRDAYRGHLAALRAIVGPPDPVFRP
ncbi:transcriptional regulator [Streptomyces microflavus]|uniref:Helix-turn-helix domain-containing protein n=1 Tax=Streptomyces microflavus TaxID=1919 RepID=A0A6N9V935_STRMI|nr:MULTISPECIES: transcriptional regulator [Streptomyces]MBK3586525.1 transcriptional regulator [Streptomyces sp. MBT57]MBK5996168.1 transcriptional regulator [Streptomyces sp. MBT58]MBW3361912.1 transcriptional regulator [Streptomyces sp. 09ZI22]MEE1731530.1 transcriptional regulator [Streptomyces sp. BE282]NEB68175.1 helix-turn-helix domain-containing protein [Streptomyces microflavus]